MSRPNKRYYKKPISTITKTQKNDVKDRILKVFESRYDKCDQTQNVISPVSSSSLQTRRRQSAERENLKDSSLSIMGNKNKKKPKRKIQRKMFDSTSSDEKDEVIVISPSVNVPSPEGSQTMRRKKRKTRAERNKNSGLSKCSVNKSENKSNVAKHISSTQTLTNAGEHCKVNDTSLSKISNTRLTKKLGLFSHGKKSSIIGREPIKVTDSVRKKTESDIWKIIHSDNEEDRPSKMDIDDIISPRDEVLPLPQSKPAKSLSSIELLVPHRPSHKTPLSKHSSTTPAHQLTLSVKSTSTGISTGCSTIPPAIPSDDSIQKSPPLRDVFNLIMNSIRKKSTVSKKEYVQEICDDLKKLMKLNASTTATPMSARIASKTSTFSKNDETGHVTWPDKCPYTSTKHTNVRNNNIWENQPLPSPKSNDIEMKMITCSQSPSSSHKSGFIDAKLLLEHNDIMQLSRPRESNSQEMMETGNFEDGSRPMSLSQSSGFHSVRSAPTPTIEHLFRDNRHDIHNHRQNLRTAIEKASRPAGTIRSTEAVVTELHPQFMPGFHGEFYKDMIQKRDSIWHETNYNSHQPQKPEINILDLLDAYKTHQNDPHCGGNHHSSHHNQLHHHQLHHHSSHHFQLNQHSHHQHQLDHNHQLDHHNQLDHHKQLVHHKQFDHQKQMDHHSNNHHSSLDLDYHNHYNHHAYIPLLPTSPILDSWNFPPLPRSSPTSPPKLFPQRLY